MSRSRREENSSTRKPILRSRSAVGIVRDRSITTSVGRRAAMRSKSGSRKPPTFWARRQTFRSRGQNFVTPTIWSCAPRSTRISVRLGAKETMRSAETESRRSASARIAHTPEPPRTGRSPGFRATYSRRLPTPMGQWQIAGFVPGHGGGGRTRFPRVSRGLSPAHPSGALLRQAPHLLAA